MAYTSRPRDEAIAWQKAVREKLIHLLKLDDLASRKTEIPFNPKVLSSKEEEKYTSRRSRSTPLRPGV